MSHATQTTLRSFVSTLLLLCIVLTHSSALAAEKGGGHEPVEREVLPKLLTLHYIVNQAPQDMLMKMCSSACG